MIAVAHTLTGCAIASQVGNLPAIVILGLVSHFALDAIPHLDEKELKKKFSYKVAIIVGAFDVLISVFLVYLIFLYKSDIGPWALILGALSATIIDLFDNSPYLKSYLRPLPVFKQIHYLHEKIHKPGEKYKYIFRVLSTAVVIGISLWIIVK